MPLGNLFFIPMLMTSAAAPVSTTPTYGLPACVESVSGLTERYEGHTLSIDLCKDGVVAQKDLEVVDMTASVIFVDVDGEVVAVRLP